MLYGTHQCKQFLDVYSLFQWQMPTEQIEYLGMSLYGKNSFKVWQMDLNCLKACCIKEHVKSM